MPKIWTLQSNNFFTFTFWFNKLKSDHNNLSMSAAEQK